MSKVKTAPQGTPQDVREVDVFKFEERVILNSITGARVAQMPFRLDEICNVMEAQNVDYVTIHPVDPADDRLGIIDLRPQPEEL